MKHHEVLRMNRDDSVACYCAKPNPDTTIVIVVDANGIVLACDGCESSWPSFALGRCIFDQPLFVGVSPREMESLHNALTAARHGWIFSECLTHPTVGEYVVHTKNAPNNTVAFTLEQS